MKIEEATYSIRASQRLKLESKSIRVGDDISILGPKDVPTAELRIWITDRSRVSNVYLQYTALLSAFFREAVPTDNKICFDSKTSIDLFESFMGQTWIGTKRCKNQLGHQVPGMMMNDICFFAQVFVKSTEWSLTVSWLKTSLRTWLGARHAWCRWPNWASKRQLGRGSTRWTSRKI